MADVTKLVINGQTYIIKDNVARIGVKTAQNSANEAQSLAKTANSTANSAKSRAESAVQRLDELSAEYSASTETISFNINV